MRKRQSSYTCLTFLKQDIEEIVQTFHDHLRDVEIIIDDVRIVDRTQLEQFDATYQATSLLARGSWQAREREDARDQGKQPPIELKIHTYRATLQWFDGNTGKESVPDIWKQLNTILLRCQNRVHLCLFLVSFSMLCFLPLTLLQSVFIQHHVNDILPQVLLTLGATVLLVPPTLWLFWFLLRLLHRETLVFLFPSMKRTTRVYGRREAVSQLIVALVLFVVLDFSLLVVLRLLWR